MRRWNGANKGTYAIVLDVLENAAASRKARIAGLLNHFYAAERPGAAMAVFDGETAVYKMVFGLANMEKNIAFTAHTSTELASVSKQFTAYAIALLMSQGKLTLEDTLQKHIPEFPNIGKEITIHHLVHHLSGIMEYDDPDLLFKNNTQASNERVLQTLYQQERTYFKPGAEYRYSNSGYVLLAEIIHRVTGESFADWMQVNIFKPLEMNTAFISVSHTKHKGAAQSYKKHKGGYDEIKVSANRYEKQSKNLYVQGAAHVYASLDDMQKWVDNYRTGKLGGAALLSLVNNGITTQAQPWDYLFGLKQYSDRGLLRRGHEGLTQGFRTVYAWYPDVDVTVVFLTNDGEWRSYYLAEKVIEIYLSERMKRSPKVSKYNIANDVTKKTTDN